MLSLVQAQVGQRVEEEVSGWAVVTSVIGKSCIHKLERAASDLATTGA